MHSLVRRKGRKAKNHVETAEAAMLTNKVTRTTLWKTTVWLMLSLALFFLASVMLMRSSRQAETESSIFFFRFKFYNLIRI